MSEPSMREQNVLPARDDAALCAAPRLELEELRQGLRAADAPSRNAAVASLAEYALVVIIGPADRPAGMKSLVASGAAHYAEPSGGYLPLALELVEPPLPEPAPTETAREPQTLAMTKDSMDNPGELLEGAKEDFGEVLRHELNNPLTGILGNAELLLAEIRRDNDGRLPPGGLQRLETIAALAVRLRETIRRLSQEWEVRDGVTRKKNDP